MGLNRQELDELQEAKFLLENPSVASRISNAIGTPIEKGLELLPSGWHSSVTRATSEALMTALRLALATLENRPGGLSSPRLHKGMAAASGAIGGAFGFSSLLLELPISTGIMLRSIADIAREMGEDLASIETQLSCLKVFALGGTATSDDAADAGYFGVRAALSRAVAEATHHIAERGLAEEGAPAIIRLITKISARFALPVTEKAAAQAIPLLGAAGGALINALFIDHFQEISRGHFTVRRLERAHGHSEVRLAYATLPQ